MIVTVDLIIGFLVGMILGRFIFPRKPKQQYDGVIEFDPKGEEIISFELWHNLYSLMSQESLLIKVKTPKEGRRDS